ncbi:MAG: hypothetical protein K2F87_06665 [Muribaculaceae bacterium]|nr:hypothetical protein [Muribaculaceae bacterium]
MKLHKSLIAAAAPAVLLGACSENAWNDHLEGFEQPSVTEGIISTADYALTTDDYKTIASLDANIALAERDGEAEALELIGTSGTFATDNQAAKYIPALLATTNKNLPYFTYNDGSAVKVTYNVAENLPDQVKGVNSGTLTYTVEEEEYQAAWRSEDNYINAFAPATPAAASIPQILLNNLSPQEGQYAVVTYNQASQNPVFGTPDSPVEETYDEIGSVTEGQTVKLKGVVTAIQARGFILSDATGSILCYQSSGFDQTALPLFSEVTLEGPVSSYNKGLQMSISDGSYQVGAVADYTYPAPRTVTGADMDAAILAETPFLAQYVQLTGTVSISGNYYNITVPGAETAIGSGYMVPDYIKAQLEDGKTYTITGYFMAISGGKYYNVTITSVSAPGTKAGRNVVTRAPLADVTTEVENAIYRYEGGSWKEASDIEVLNPADYKAMGLTYGNFSGSQPDTYLPVYLKTKYPYAAPGDTKTIAYIYYANGSSSYNAKEYVLGETGIWTVNAGSSTSQFVKMDGEWKFNPSVVLTLPYARNTDPSYTYYMACVEWVYENIAKPMGSASLTAGDSFIDYRGNAEFYSGASAYYGNIDVRAASALNNMPEGYTGYDGLSDEEITLLMKKRFCTEVFPGALAKIHADAKPIEGMDVTYTFNITAYTGSAEEAQVVYLLTGPGEFTYLSSTWVSEAESESWKN